MGKCSLTSVTNGAARVKKRRNAQRSQWKHVTASINQSEASNFLTTGLRSHTLFENADGYKVGKIISLLEDSHMTLDGISNTYKSLACIE